MYLYYTEEKTSGWEIQLVKPGTREALAESVKPKYITVLDVSEDVTDEMSAEDIFKVRYSGPFYADWDCPDIMEGVESVKRFLTLLQETYDVDPECVRLYATGGRGFHAEIPFALFSAGRPDVVMLPYVYREIANDLYTEHMDMAVYSGRRGRMWRTPNVERETKGRYKVPISYAQLLEMDSDSYDELCSAPRPYPKLRRVEAVSPKLATRFALHKGSVDKALKNRLKAKDQSKILESFHGEWPESVQKLMAGEIPTNPNTGLNKIALQLSILATGLGKSRDDLLEACEGLIRHYRGDGHRTASSVRKELVRIFNYVDGNPCYSYSPGGLMSIFGERDDTRDLQGGMPSAAAPAEALRNMADLTQGLVVGSNGLYTYKGQDGNVRETNWHFDQQGVTEVLDAHTLAPRGFMLMGLDSGEARGEVSVDHATFVSADKAKMWLAKQGATAPKLDSVKAGGMLGLIMSCARQNDRVLAIDKEGFTLIVRHTEEGEEHDMVWAGPTGCYAKNPNAHYRYRSGSGSEHGNFRSDILVAPELRNLSKAPEVLRALLHINGNDYTVAALLGWLAACWIKPYHLLRKEGSFPLLQSYGESGSGKTALNALLLHMFYYRNPPVMTNARTGTGYGRRVLFGASTTIPIYVDEYKPRHMNRNEVMEFQAMIHEMYTPKFAAPRGGGDVRSSAPGQWAELSMDVKTTPLSFSTENPITETAIQERTLAVPFSKAAREDHTSQFNTVAANTEVLAALGRSMLNAALHLPKTTIDKLIERSEQLAAEALSRSGNSRIVYNISVALSGIGLLELVIKKLLPELGEELVGRFSTLRGAMLSQGNYSSLSSVPELVKVLRFMVQVSNMDGLEADHTPKPGRDFSYTPNRALEIDVPAFYLRYTLAAQKYNQSLLFPDADGMYMALRLFKGLEGLNPTDSELLNPTVGDQLIARLSADAMVSAGVGVFKLK